MKSFEYAAPQTLRDALALLSKQRGEAEILAGGTDLITCMKQGLTAPKRLVSLRNIAELRGVEATRVGVRLGAMTPLEAVAADATVRRRFPALVTAIEGIGSPQLLATGTVGGDLCQRPRCWYYRNGFGLLALQGDTSLVREGQNQYHAVFTEHPATLFVSPSSLGPALVALRASLTLVGPDGTRRIEAADFFRTPRTNDERENVLRPDEVLSEVVIPDLGLRNATYEVRHRHGLDWPYVTASVAYTLREDGTAAGARVVLGHVAPVPWLARASGPALEASRIDDASATRCAAAAIQGAEPLSKNGYKTQMIRTAVKRAVLAAAGTPA